MRECRLSPFFGTGAPHISHSMILMILGLAAFKVPRSRFVETFRNGPFSSNSFLRRAIRFSKLTHSHSSFVMLFLTSLAVRNRLHLLNTGSRKVSAYPDRPR